MDHGSSEPDFLAALQAGDDAAFRELVRQYHRQLVGVAGAICGEAFGEEVVQDAWIAIHRSLPAFEGRSTLKTWIYTIVLNTARSRRRKESRSISLADVDEPLSGLDPERFDQSGGWSRPPPDWDLDSPEELLEQTQLRDCIEKTVNALPEKQRAVFVLVDVEQENPEAIRNDLALTESNFRVLLHRARVRLMQMIDTYRETGSC